MDTQTLDAALIEQLGGSTKLAKLLTERGGEVFSPQRVNNWKDDARGIPAEVKVAFPDLFMPRLVAKTEGGTNV